MKRKIWILLIVLISAALIGLGAYYVYPQKNPKSAAANTPVTAKTKHRVYLIGLDGASWNLIEGPLREGKLPNFQRLIQGGTYGPLKSFIPTKSPVLWTSIATGKTQLKHGIGNYTAEKDGQIIPVSGGERITKAFWNITSEYGLSTGVVNWWVTWPPEKVNGYMVSDRWRNASKKILHTELTYPVNLVDQLPNVGMTKDRFLEDCEKFRLPVTVHPAAESKNVDILYDGYKTYWGQDKAVREACRRLTEKHPVDVFGVVFRIIDVSSHLYWTYLDQNFVDGMRAKQQAGTMTDEDTKRIDAAFTKIIEPIYIYADHILGDFLKHQDKDTTFIICSDHGFKFEEGRYGHSNMKTPPDGVVILNGPAFRKNVRIEGATLLDITPTLLYLEGIPVGQDMDGKVLFSAFNPEYLKKFPPTLVASHDKGERQKGQPASSEMDKEILEDLRSLGYIQ
ncbi:MAG TPA: alkaline phosphatase family protein [Acidobacteriota bacterium]|nr:alkaline phosphatase family protein [Acidobacteriota bacterium]